MKKDSLKFVDLNRNAYASKTGGNIEDEELPLLEELGISPQNIKQKLISVLTFHKIDKKILEDADMAGPLLVLILFAVSLVLVKLFYFIKSKPKHISDIYTDYLFLEV